MQEEKQTTMGEKNTPTNGKKVQQEEDFLSWPPFEIIQNDLAKSIYRYRNRLIILRDTVEKIKDWESEEIFEQVKARFKNLKLKTQKLLKNAEEYGNDEEKENLEKQLEKLNDQILNWTPEKNVELAKLLYNKIIDMIAVYAAAYEDLIAHKKALAERKKQLAKSVFDKIDCEKDSFLTEFSKKLKSMSVKPSQSSKISEFFDELSLFLSISLGISFKNPTRLKSWYRFMEKLHDRAESLDITELDSYNDIYGTMFIVPSTNNDEQDIENCYILANQICKYMERYKNAKILKPKFVGTPSSLIYPEYAKYVKDYFQNPKPTGYQAIHICFAVEIRMPDGEKRVIKFEVQIVTMQKKLIANDKKAHGAYKKNRKQLNWDISKLKTEWWIAKQDTCDLAYIDYDGFLEALPLNSIREY